MIERDALTKARALEHRGGEEVAATRLAADLSARLDDFDARGASEAARALESFLNREADSLSPGALSSGFELLARAEIVKHQTAGEGGDPTALARAADFIARAKDAARSGP
jgi:hypothetical protein